MKNRRDNQALLVNSDVSEITPGRLFAAEKDSSNLLEEQVISIDLYVMYHKSIVNVDSMYQAWE
jgi:hypothetical protein